MRKIISNIANKFSKASMVIGMAVVLLLPQIGYSQAVEEDPTALAMTGDLVIARPILLVTTVLGSVAYLVSLPFSLAGGNADAAAETLVMGPARSTFVRCLGCTRSGYKKDVVNSDD